MTQYNFSDLNTAATPTAIPPKSRTVKKSPLYARMEKMNVGGAFVIDEAQMATVAANVYATAKRLGIKVTLRQLAEGVGVWRVRNTNPQTDVERAKESGRGRRAASKPATRTRASARAA